MTRSDALSLSESLRVGDVSRAWLVWSGAAETALAEAYQFAGSPIPARGLVLVVVVPCSGLLGLVGVRFGRLAVTLLMLMMLLMSLCIETLLLLLDVRRRSKAVMVLLDSMIRKGLPLLVQSSLGLFNGIRSLLLGPFFLLRWMILMLFGVLALVLFIILLVVFTGGSVTSSMGLSYIVGERLFRCGGRISWFHPYKWLWPDMVLPAPLLQCKHNSSGGSGILLGLTRNSERLGFPTFAGLGKGTPALKNSMRRLRVSCLFCLKFLASVDRGRVLLRPIST